MMSTPASAPAVDFRRAWLTGTAELDREGAAATVDSALASLGNDLHASAGMSWW